MSEVFTEINLESAKAIFDGAIEVFGGGIYVKSENGHPCGWDFIDLRNLENIEADTISNINISDGFGSDDFEDKTLLQILEMVGMKGWCYEPSRIDYFE